MARAVKIEISAKDRATRTFKIVRRDLRNLKKTVLSVRGALAGIGVYLAGRELIRFSKQSLAAWGEQEKAVAGLHQALVSMGRYTPELEQNLINMAASLQQVGVAGDESLIQAQKLLATYRQIGDDTLPRATQATADLAALTGMSLPTAATIMGKAAMGMTGQLSRYGITLSEQAKKSKDFSLILKEIEQQVRGQNLAMRMTTEGGMVALKNSIGDITEQFGRLVTSLNEAGLLDWFIGLADAVAILFDSINDDMESNTEMARSWVNRIIDFFKTLVKAAEWVVRIVRKIFLSLKTILYGVVAAIFKFLEEKLGVFLDAAIRVLPEKYAQSFKEFREGLSLAAEGMWDQTVATAYAIDEVKNYSSEIDNLFLKADEYRRTMQDLRQERENIRESIKPVAGPAGEEGQGPDEIPLDIQAQNAALETSLAAQRDIWAEHESAVKGMHNSIKESAKSSVADIIAAYASGQKPTIRAFGGIIGGLAKQAGQFHILEGLGHVAEGIALSDAKLVGAGMMEIARGGALVAFGAAIGKGGGGAPKGAAGAGAGGFAGRAEPVPGMGMAASRAREGRIVLDMGKLGAEDIVTRPRDFARVIVEELSNAQGMNWAIEVAD